jgi:hypothetical protein
MYWVFFPWWESRQCVKISFSSMPLIHLQGVVLRHDDSFILLYTPYHLQHPKSAKTYTYERQQTTLYQLYHSLLGCKWLLTQVQRQDIDKCWLSPRILLSCQMLQQRFYWTLTWCDAMYIGTNICEEPDAFLLKLPWRQRHYVPPKCMYLPNYSVTSHKAIILMDPVTASSLILMTGSY